MAVINQKIFDYPVANGNKQGALHYQNIRTMEYCKFVSDIVVD
jgi:hypothetical protein